MCSVQRTCSSPCVQLAETVIEHADACSFLWRDRRPGHAPCRLLLWLAGRVEAVLGTGRGQIHDSTGSLEVWTHRLSSPGLIVPGS